MMGDGRYDASTYTDYAKSRSTRTVDDYTATTVKKEMDPKMIKVRESVKSASNPLPTPIIAGLDVTGSMNKVVEVCRRGLGTLFKEIIEREPVSDPHVLAMAIGDMDYDRSPVQATQFEGDPVVIGTQIEELHLEGGGGGNHHESYLGPWYFALNRTSCDAFRENPSRKGYIFTVGDEEPQLILTKSQIERWFGDQPKRDYTAQELLTALEQNWHVFHLIVEEGDHFVRMGRGPTARKQWSELLGQRAIPLADHTKMAEVIVSIIQVTEGHDNDAVSASWSGGTELVVAKAIGGLAKGGHHAGGPVAL